jgi:hypothetical protein
MLTETAAPTLTDTDIQSWLAGKLDGSHAEFGAVDATTIITAFGATSCSGFSRT